MILREFRRADGPRFFALLKSEFPEEEAMLGMRPEGFETILRRLYRPGTRVLLGLLRAFHRSPFHLYVAEEAGTIAGMTQLSFAPRTGFLSTVVVAPEFRRRGIARRLIERAREETARRGRRYVALRVLESNAPARALYAATGYVELDRQQFVVQETPAALAPATPPSAIRPFTGSDAPALAELADGLASARTREVLPSRPQEFSGHRWADRIFDAETTAWVVDRGHGPEAYVAATATPTTEAAHLSPPLLGPSVEPELAAALVRTACLWLAARRPARIVTSVLEGNERGHLALREVGFHDAMAFCTLYRTSR